MIMSEKTLDLQSLRFALTIVMGNDIVVPECDFTINQLDKYPRVDGYTWGYKGHYVRVCLLLPRQQKYLWSSLMRVLNTQDCL